MPARKLKGDDLLRTHHEAAAQRAEDRLRIHAERTLARLAGRPTAARAEGLRALLAVMRLHDGCTRGLIEEVAAILDDLGPAA